MQRNTISVGRFAIPVILENTITVFIAMVVSAIIGGISGSALAGVSTANTFVNVLSASMSLLTTGSAIIVSRTTGAGDRKYTSTVIEQTILLAIILSSVIVILVECFTHPLLCLLVPGADDVLYSSTRIYLRVMILSFPCTTVYNALISTLRATGNSRAGMYIAISVNLLQLLLAWLLIGVMKLDLIGAGLVMVFTRIISAVITLWVIKRPCDKYKIRLHNVLKADKQVFISIVRIGISTSLENVCIQLGYLVANSLTVGLGTIAASAHSVSSSITTFPALPMGICIAVATTAVGQHIGAGEIEKARKTALNIWTAAMAISIVMGIVFALLGGKLAEFYTKDPQVITLTGTLMWLQLWYIIPGASINAIDPTLRTGGEQKFVMWQSLIGVWCIRLPLSYLLGYTFKMGIYGVYCANGISLTARAISGFIKYKRNHWIHERI